MRYAVLLAIALLVVMSSAGCGRGPGPHASAADPAAAQTASAAEEIQVPEGLLIVERDVSQTRVDFAPVINHEAMVANTSGGPLKVDIESPFPRSAYLVTEFYPAFGQTSLLGEPMRFPGKVSIRNYNVLEKPAISTADKDVTFAWRNVAIPAGDAAIAQYDQYAGPLSQYYASGQLQALGLAISIVPRIEKTGDTASLTFRLRIQNNGKAKFESLNFDLLVPDTIHSLEGAADTVLLTNVRASASDGVTQERSAAADGRSRPATGTLFRAAKDVLPPGGTFEATLTINGKVTGAADFSHPLVTLLGLSRGDRVWPETVVTSTPEVPASRFYYRQANLILPAPTLLRFAGGDIKSETYTPPSVPAK